MGYVPQTGQASSDAPQLRIAKELESAGVAIAVALGWQTLSDGTRSLTGSFQSTGGTSLEVTLWGSASVLVGGSVRVVINGGSFSNAVITVEPATLAIGAQKIMQSGSVEIPVTGSPTTYTVTAQGQGVGLFASITPASGTNLLAKEWPVGE